MLATVIRRKISELKFRFNTYMETILVDAVNTLVNRDGSIFTEMHTLLEGYPNRKIILTGASDEQFKQFGLDKMPYEVFTLKHDPEKTDSRYYEIMLKHFDLKKDEVVYFEHNAEAFTSAQSIGIPTYWYDPEKKDLAALQAFLDSSISNNDARA